MFISGIHIDPNSFLFDLIIKNCFPMSVISLWQSFFTLLYKISKHLLPLPNPCILRQLHDSPDTYFSPCLLNSLIIHASSDSQLSLSNSIRLTSKKTRVHSAYDSLGFRMCSLNGADHHFCHH